MSNTRLTHATPAAIYAVAGERGWENDNDIPDGCGAPSIAKQLEQQLENGFLDLAFAGGKEINKQETFTGGRFGTGYNVYNGGAEFRGVDWNVALNKSALFAGGYDLSGDTATASNGAGGMSFESERPASEPSFKEMTLNAIKQLKAKSDADPNGDGYFLMAESGLLDWALHVHNLRRVVEGMAHMDETIKEIKQLIGDDTLLIVAADHSQGLSFAGYAGSGTSVLGYSQVACQGQEPTPDWDNMPNTGCAYVDYSGRLINLAVYAMGPGAQSAAHDPNSAYWADLYTQKERDYTQYFSPKDAYGQKIPYTRETMCT